MKLGQLLKSLGRDGGMAQEDIEDLEITAVNPINERCAIVGFYQIRNDLVLKLSRPTNAEG